MTIDSVKKMKDALCEKLKVSFGSTVEEASDAQMMRASALVPVSYTHLDGQTAAFGSRRAQWR